MVIIICDNRQHLQRRIISFLCPMRQESNPTSHLIRGPEAVTRPNTYPNQFVKRISPGRPDWNWKGSIIGLGDAAMASCEWESTSGCVLMQPGYYYCYSVRHGYGVRTYWVRAQAKSQSILLLHRSAIHFGPGYRSPVYAVPPTWIEGIILYSVHRGQLMYGVLK